MSTFEMSAIIIVILQCLIEISSVEKYFVEKSSELVLLKQHYIDLLINKLFLSQIAKVAAKLKNKNINIT